MRRSFCILLSLMVATVMICSCSVVSAVQEKNDLDKQKEEIAEDILNYVLEGQTESLYEMFAPTDKSETTKQQLETMFEQTNWEEFNTDKMEQNENGGGAKYRDGRVAQESFGYKYEHVIDDKGKEYMIGFGYTLTNEDEPDKIGLNRLSIRVVTYKDGYIPEVQEEYIAGRE